MASIQRYLISFLVILTFSFVYFAQASEAAKGPKITHKVRALRVEGASRSNADRS